ncbi:hypothetical protein [Celerinatantimonas sp. MCCC 1A17872]
MEPGNVNLFDACTLTWGISRHPLRSCRATSVVMIWSVLQVFVARVK